VSGAHLRGADWLARGRLSHLLALLDGGGEEARVVGGAVRDALMGEPIAEIDVATTAVPEEVVRRVERAGLKAVPTGIEHGTVTVVVDGTPCEVTTLREDVETFGRRAAVRFGRDWKRDAERRDFTMNALSAARDGTVFDYVNGIADLQARRVRFIGDPAMRIAEDFLRILRFFRFNASHGRGPPDAAAVVACVRMRAGLETLSRERVRMELFKLLVAAHPLPGLVIMAETGLLSSLLAGVPLLASFENTVKIETAIGIPPDPVRRLGALAVRISEDAARLTQRLRLAKIEQERLGSMAEAWWRVDPRAGGQAARALLYRLNPENYIDRVVLAWSRSQAGVAAPAWQELAALSRSWIIPVFPLRSGDFVARGVQKGPALGVAMRAAEEAWISADFPSDSAAVAAIADEAARSG
jgi:tRNA nucleotidyltransferase/poly(A) polymerase